MLGAEISAGPPGRPALHAHPRFDGPRPARWRAAAGPRGRGHHDTILTASAAGDRHLATTTPARLDAAHGLAPCSPFSVTGDLLRDMPPRWRATRACDCTPTSRKPWTRRSSAASASAAPRCGTWRRWTGWATTSGWPTASTSTTRPSRKLADTGPASRTARRPTLRLGAGIASHRRPARGRVPVGPRRGRRGQQRGLLADRGGPARPAVRPRPRRPAGAGRPGRAGAGHDRRRRLLGWDDQIGSLEPGKRQLTSRSGGSTARRTPISPTPVAALVLGAPPPLELLLARRPTRWSSGTTWSPSTSTNSPNPRASRTDR